MDKDSTVLEFYCGIGGLHHAYCMSGGKGKVVAYDINDVATKVYEHNFKGEKVKRVNLETITLAEIERYSAKAWILSPPCQPYNSCIMSKKLDMEDKRSLSLQHLMKDILPNLQTKPSYFLLENVKGFYTSKTRELVLSKLKENGYDTRELLLSPSHFGFPNQRLRCFLLAKRAPLKFASEPCMHSALFSAVLRSSLENRAESEQETEAKKSDVKKDEKEDEKEKKEEKVFCSEKKSDDVSDDAIKLPSCTAPDCLVCHLGSNLRDFLEPDTPELEAKYSVPEKLVLAHGLKFDIVSRDSDRSCCFTKSYSRLMEGAGSVIKCVDENSVGITDPKELLKLKLRFFTPTEIARLHGFPPHFSFPDTVTDRQRYNLLGNSLNCVVLSHLMQYLFDDSV